MAPGLWRPDSSGEHDLTKRAVVSVETVNPGATENSCLVDLEKYWMRSELIRGMPIRRHRLSAAIVTLVLLLLVWFLVGAWGNAAEIGDLSYLPILVAAWFFGVPGGLAAALAAGFLIGPLGLSGPDNGEGLVGDVMYALIGGFSGGASTLLAHRYERLASATDRLQLFLHQDAVTARGGTRVAPDSRINPSHRLGDGFARPDRVPEPTRRRIPGSTIGHFPPAEWSPLLYPDDADYALRAWQYAVQETLPIEADYRIKGADGQYWWVTARALPVTAPCGTVRRWIGTLTDIRGGWPRNPLVLSSHTGR